jgi:hypothetical protein
VNLKASKEKTMLDIRIRSVANGFVVEKSDQPKSPFETNTPTQFVARTIAELQLVVSGLAKENLSKEYGAKVNKDPVGGLDALRWD